MTDSVGTRNLVSVFFVTLLLLFCYSLFYGMQCKILFFMKSSVNFTLVTNTLCQKAEFSLGWRTQRQ